MSNERLLLNSFIILHFILVKPVLVFHGLDLPHIVDWPVVPVPPANIPHLSPIGLASAKPARAMDFTLTEPPKIRIVIPGRPALSEV